MPTFKTFDEWCAAEGVYLNDNDDAAKAAKAMARSAWHAAETAQRDQLAKVSAALQTAIHTLERDGDEWAVCDHLREALKATN